MTMSLVTDILGDMPLEQMLDTVSGLGFEAVELGCGNWSKAPHMWMGGDPIAAVRLLGDAIHYLHAKDVRRERVMADNNGLIDTYRMDEIAKRAWNYVALGHGHDVQWWKEFFAVARLAGYDGPVSLEMEDMGLEPLTGVKASLTTLKLALPRNFDRRDAQALADIDRKSVP